MPNHSVARLNDTGSHNGADRGTITTSAKRTYLNNSLPARVGDTYICPKHGVNAIRTGSLKVWVESRRLARVGSKTWCGATIDSGAHNVTDGSAETDPFADPAAASGGFDVSCVPEIMFREEWPIAAKFLVKWITARANPDLDKGATDTTSVTLEWLESFPRAKAVLEEISDPLVWFNEAAQRQLCEEIADQGAFRNSRSTFGDDLKGPIQELDRFFFQQRDANVGRFNNASALFDPDHLDAALHAFSFRAVASGFTEPHPAGHGVVIEKVAVYARDQFEFGDEQDLGWWDCENKKYPVPPIPGFHAALSNRDFREYRSRTGQGGDFLIFSNMRLLELDRNYSFVCPTPFGPA
jgi:uncharacterized Zn-binding protein involved in type VI secretion